MEKRLSFLDAYLEMKQKQKEKPGTGPGYYRMKQRNLGRKYISTVLDAYYQERITGSDLAGYLEMKLDYLPRLESLFETG